MPLPWLRQLDPNFLRFLAILELALPFYLLIGILGARSFMAERLGWKRFPTALPRILLFVPAVAFGHEHYLGKIAVFFAVLWVFAFVLVGMRTHILFEDCMLPFAFSRHDRSYKLLCALQIFWWIQAPAAAFNGLNWPRGLLWTQAGILALTIAITVGFAIADSRPNRK